MTKASDNSYPSILVAEQGSTPSSPAAGKQRLFIKTSDHLLYYVNSSGTVTAVGSGTGTAVATDTIWDAAGDLAVGTGADTAAKLSIGTTRKNLQSNGTTAVWAYPAFIGCKAYHSTTQSLTTATWTSVNLDSEEFDTDTIHSTSSNTSRMTVPFTGYYMIQGGATFESNATGDRYLRIYKNGTTEVRAVQNAKSTASGASDMRQVSAVLSLTAADYIEMQAFQDSGGNLNIGTGTTYFQTQLSITFLGV